MSIWETKIGKSLWLQNKILTVTIQTCLYIFSEARYGVMDRLGCLEDLPQDFVRKMHEIELKPLWPSLRALLPPRSSMNRESAFHWQYQLIRPLLLLSGELTPISKAERRVLVLSHPDSDEASLRATPSIYAGIQLILPGESAPSHRHNASAARIAIETAETYTIVDGKSYLMERGDLILTPYGMWHEHYHSGNEPATWLDVLDLPLVNMLGISYSENDPGNMQAEETENPDSYGKHKNRLVKDFPVIKFPWFEIKETLEVKASYTPYGDLVLHEYINPHTKDACLKTLGFFAALVRIDEVCNLAKNSSTGIIHVIEGSLEIEVDGVKNHCLAGDVISLPTFSKVTFSNRSNALSYFICANDKPLQSRLGLFEISAN